MSLKNKERQSESKRQRGSECWSKPERESTLQRTPTEKRYKNWGFIIFERLGGCVARTNYDLERVWSSWGPTFKVCRFLHNKRRLFYIPRLLNVDFWGKVKGIKAKIMENKCTVDRGMQETGQRKERINSCKMKRIKQEHLFSSQIRSTC